MSNMNILIMKKTDNSEKYERIFSDSLDMYFLGRFLNEIAIESALQWAQSWNSSGCTVTNEIIYEKDYENVRIYSCPDYLPVEKLNYYPEYYYENAFMVSFFAFFTMLLDFRRTLSGKPEFIIITKTDNGVIVCGDFREKLNFKHSATTTKEKINELLKTRILDNFFCNELMLKSVDKNFKIYNNTVDLYGALSADIESDQECAFNHSFFQKSFNFESLEQELQNHYKWDIPFINGITKFSNGKKAYIVAKVTTKNFSIRVILNKDFELIHFYPIFRRAK